ncbi:hypothetical protein ScPMuIL_012261 [Solemya velum]
MDRIAITYFLVLSFVWISLSYAGASQRDRQKSSDIPKLLLISFDGFRWDYLAKAETPNFDRFMKNGVHANFGLKNAFLTKTFPNHYTLITGLYEESHGVVGNVMFDPVFNETFNIYNNVQEFTSKWFDNGGEPIWVTNQKSNPDRHSGTMFWPGDSAVVKNVAPFRYLLYNRVLDNKTRVDIITEWFSDRYPINLGLLYFEEPDATGHHFGPDSVQVADMVAALDELFGYILQKLEAYNLLSEMNIIVTSDHGMSSTPEDRIIDLDQYVSPSMYRIFSSNPVGAVLPNSGYEEEVYDNFTNAHPNLHVYKKKDIPDEWHFKHNRRIQPLLLVADEGYSLRRNNSAVPAGNHGYNNSLPDMHPFFIAAGPAFKSGVSIDTFNNVDLYPMMCYILDLEPAPNNGSLENVKQLLKDKLADDVQDKEGVSTFWIYIGILVFIVLVGGVFGLAACRQHRYHKRKHITFGGVSEMGTFPSSDVMKTSLLHISDSEDSDVLP